MLFDFKTNEVSNYNLAFTIDIGKTEWYECNIKQKQNFLETPGLKESLPKKQLFNINSLIFNLENHKREVYTKYNCYFDDTHSAFCIVVNDKASYADFSKEVMMNLMDFVQKANINYIYFLISRNNRQYIKLLQGMLTVGFENDENVKTTQIDGVTYKVLKMNLKQIPDEIEEIDF